MEYETIAHAIKLGGTVFFFGFFFIAMAYLFWPKQAKSPLTGLAMIIGAFIGFGLLIFLAAELGGFAAIALALFLLLAFVGSMYVFRSTNDQRYSSASQIPLQDEDIIRDHTNE